MTLVKQVQDSMRAAYETAQMEGAQPLSYWDLPKFLAPSIPNQIAGLGDALCRAEAQERRAIRGLKCYR